MKKMKKTLLFAGVIAILVLAVPLINLVAGKSHSPKLAALASTDPAFGAAREVMQGKCAHCHTTDAGTPFYAALPGVSGTIKKDVEMGLRFLDLTDAFSEGTVSLAALAKIEHALEQNSMPPGKYVAMHWNAGLSSSDREALRNWIRAERVKHPATQGLAKDLAEKVIPPIAPARAEKAQRVALGRQLFHDTRLSKDNTLSCASCHELTKGGCDQKPVATGVGNAQGPINSPTVYNAGYHVKQFWDGRAADLKAQAAGPVENPIEMAESWDNVVKKLKQDETFKAAFEKEYPAGLSKDTITDAIATYERTLVTPDSRFDKFLKGDATALNDAEKEGHKLFMEIGCANCHCGPAMGGMSFELMGRAEDYFASRGKPAGAVDQGRFGVTQRESDKHKFKVPSLRNVAVTFPYFHDAGAKDLESATRTMAKVQFGRSLSDAEVSKIVAFLKTLTGTYEGKMLASGPSNAEDTAQAQAR